MRRILALAAAAVISSACTLALPGQHNPGVEIAKIMADAQIKTVQAITAAFTKADAAACSTEVK